MKFTESVFKAYDIRGKVPNELTPEVAKAVGRALADFLPEGKVAVGRDMRPDSEQLSSAIIEGLIVQGREVVDLGQITSDMIYFAVGNYDFAGGAMVTASHDPRGYNGIKLTNKGVKPIGEDTGLMDIKKAVITDSFKESSGSGSKAHMNILNDWVTHALKFAPNLGSLKVGIDAGNGMAGIVVPKIQEQTHLDINGIFLNLDGTFPNHPANPLIPENMKDLQNLVKSQDLDCGIAFDGDGDRAMLVDENGELVTGSVLGALLTEKFLSENPGSTILYNVIVSHLVPEIVEEMGGKAIRTKVGHSFIKADMRKYNAIFACEHSGHYYFKNNYMADSGLIAALCALDIMSQSGKKLSELCEPLRSIYSDSGEINFEINNKEAALKAISNHFSDGKQDSLDGLTINYPDWWLNLRASNTEPLLRLNIEAENSDMMQSKLKETKEIIENYID
jgi:phosphomannomutase